MKEPRDTLRTPCSDHLFFGHPVFLPCIGLKITIFGILLLRIVFIRSVFYLHCTFQEYPLCHHFLANSSVILPVMVLTIWFHYFAFGCRPLRSVSSFAALKATLIIKPYKSISSKLSLQCSPYNPTDAIKRL